MIDETLSKKAKVNDVNDKSVSERESKVDSEEDVVQEKSEDEMSEDDGNIRF